MPVTYFLVRRTRDHFSSSLPTPDAQMPTWSVIYAETASESVDGQQDFGHQIADSSENILQRSYGASVQRLMCTHTRPDANTQEVRI